MYTYVRIVISTINALLLYYISIRMFTGYAQMYVRENRIRRSRSCVVSAIFV